MVFVYRDAPVNDEDQLAGLLARFEDEGAAFAFSSSQLVKQHGWNGDRIDRVLGEPDFIADDGAKMFVLDRVELGEDTELFRLFCFGGGFCLLCLGLTCLPYRVGCCAPWWGAVYVLFL